MGWRLIGADPSSVDFVFVCELLASPWGNGNVCLTGIVACVGWLYSSGRS
jgi:hypothetical protein